MLLPRTGVRLKPVHRAAARCALRVAERRTVSYSSKVRALPFVLTPEDAKRRVSAMAAAFTSLSPGRIFSAFLGSRGLGGDIPQPSLIQALYLPVWFVDGLIDARIHLSTTEESDAQNSPAFRSVRMRLSYMPGFSLEPMSRMGFAELGQDQLLLNSIPFDEALTTQHGMDVKCLPYSSTPFSIEHATRNIPSTVRTISKGFKFEPKTVLIDIMAAYPVLIPVYLMQYEGTPLGLSGISFTSLVDAARKESLVFVENILPELGQIATNFLGSDDLFELPDYVVAQDFLKAPWSRSTTSDFAQVKRFRGLKDEHLEELTAWIDHKVSRRGVMQHYEDIQCSLKQPVDMDHLLIRSAEEISEVHMYMHAEMKYGVSWSKCKKASSTLSEYDDELEELSKSNEKLKDVLNGGRQDIAKMNTQLEKTRKCLQDMKPEWRKQWEEQQTSDYIAQVQDRFPWRAPQTDDCGL